MASSDESNDLLPSLSPSASPKSPAEVMLSSQEGPTSPTTAEATIALPPMSPTRTQSERQVPPPSVSNMTASSTPLGSLNAARRPPGAQPPTAARGGAGMNPDIAAKMRAMMLSRQGSAPRPGQPNGAAGPGTPGGAGTPSGMQSPGPGGLPAGFRLPPNLSRPAAQSTNSSPVVTGARGPAPKPSMAERRGMKLPGGLPGATPPTGGRQKPSMKLSDIGGGQTNGDAAGGQGTQQQEDDSRKAKSAMDKYADLIDTKTGALVLGKMRVDGQGIQFTSGRSFSISLDEVDTLDELGKGNYGTVYKVRHARPRFRKTGQGLAGNKSRGSGAEDEPPSPTTAEHAAKAQDGTTGTVMAMKEMRLELDDAKFQSIIMELDILHRCMSPCIVDFYGAFFQEGAVYICMEFMDGGSIDKIYGDGVPEEVLRKITLNTVLGLKSLKEEHNIIHRDVKPTNILANTRGQVKICDFGVSGNLVASIAKTNIGCQSYMAPERISSGGMASAGPGAGTYSVQSDIWSLGLSIIECAMGRYPYPPETYDNIFSQLSAIVDGVPPDLPTDKFSEAAHDFVAGCLNKIPKLRPTYPMLLQHAWLAPLLKPTTITEEDEEAAERAAERGEDLQTAASGAADGVDANGFIDEDVGRWVLDALEKKRKGKLAQSAKPALHAAPLDAAKDVASPGAARNNAGAVAVDA